jgi:Holliday junction resolvase RusA-like endonuclease
MTEFLIDPVAKPRMTQRDKWAHRKCVDDYYSFKDKLVLLCKQQKFILPDKFKVEFLIPTPDSWKPVRQIDMIGKPHQQRPDLDNLTKAILDCLRDEDKYVYHIDAAKYWWNEGKIIFYDIKDL